MWRLMLAVRRRGGGGEEGGDEMGAGVGWEPVGGAAGEEDQGEAPPQPEPFWLPLVEALGLQQSPTAPGFAGHGWQLAVIQHLLSQWALQRHTATGQPLWSTRSRLGTADGFQLQRSLRSTWQRGAEKARAGGLPAAAMPPCF